MVRRPLPDTENHEFGGTDERDTNKDNEPAIVEVVLSYGGPVTPNEKRLVRFATGECAFAELYEEKLLDSPAHLPPQRLAIRLEHDPLRPLIDGAFEVGEVSPQADVFPLGVRSHCWAKD
jgi:hypothetical protein